MTALTRQNELHRKWTTHHTDKGSTSPERSSSSSGNRSYRSYRSYRWSVQQCDSSSRTSVGHQHFWRRRAKSLTTNHGRECKDRFMLISEPKRSWCSRLGNNHPWPGKWVFAENLVVLGFLQSVSYTKSIPTHEKSFAVWKSGPNYHFQPNVSWVGLALGCWGVRRFHINIYMLSHKNIFMLSNPNRIWWIENTLL